MVKNSSTTDEAVLFFCVVKTVLSLVRRLVFRSRKQTERHCAAHAHYSTVGIAEKAIENKYTHALALHSGEGTILGGQNL